MCWRPTALEYRGDSSLEGIHARADILYMTRVQKERFFNEEDYILPEEQLGIPSVSEKMALAKT